MTLFAHSAASRSLVLRLSKAAELMTPNPLCFDKYTTIEKAAALFEFHDLEAAAVVDEHSRPIGVVTMDACVAWQEFCIRSSPHGFISEDLDETTVEEIMRPIVGLVHEDDSSRDVIERLLEQRLSRAYVVNDEGELVGVVSRADVLRHLLASGVREQVFAADASLLS